jgi:hypothetical protein
MKLTTLHPTMPRMAYVLELIESTTATTTAKTNAQRQLVVQDYNSSVVLFQLSLGDFCALLFDFDPTSPAYAAKLAAGLRSMGKVEGISFFDSATLFATGMVHQEAAESSATGGTTATSTTVSSSSTSSTQQQQQQQQQQQAASQKLSGHFNYLIVQLSSRIVLLNLQQGPNSLALDSTLRVKVNPISRTPCFQPIVAQIGESALKALPTTIAIPLTPSFLLIGCADGSIKVYDWKAEKLVKTGRGPSGKNDAIWHLITTNRYNDAMNHVLRITSISKKATAYLWELTLSPDHADIDIRLPVCRMDGVFGSNSASSSAAGAGDSVTSKSRSLSPSPTNAAGTSSSATAAASLVNEYWDHSLIDFDAHRQLFMWFVPFGFKNSARPHLLVWDLSLSHGLKNKNTNVPKQEPYIVSFATLDLPSVTIVPGWLHPDFSAQALTCALVSQTGELFLQVVNLKADCKPGKTTKALPWFTTSISGLIQKAVDASAPPMLRVSKLMTHRRLDTTTLLVGTSLGVVQVGFSDNMIGARHAHLPTHLVGTEWGKAAIYVNQSTIYWAPLDMDEKNKTGCVDFASQQGSPDDEHQAIYQSPWDASVPMTKRSVRLPPRIFPSPSGKYLCLYWSDEKRYEMLHIDSTLNKNKKSSTANADITFAPAVADGTNVLDVAWVGDDDVFALLHPPMERRAEEAALPSPSATDMVISGSMSVGSAAVKTLRKNFKIGRDKSNKDGKASHVSTMSMDDGAFSSKDGTRFNPRVELKMLVGVSANAAELGSIAAATARGLGDITLRGGNRNKPTALFGGPNLCVSCQDKKGQDGGAANFYTLKPGVEENMASNFIQAGPTLPCPDFVQWDEEGILCALVVQGLVAIYLSRDGEFTLLGNVPLGAPAERNVALTGLKFVHGVLYCTTRTSVQCIFLGDIVNDGICFLDAYTLVSCDGPYIGPSSSMSPPTIAMTLNHPSVLGYQSGSLLVSTVTGLLAISLDHPLLRIGALIAAGHVDRAQRWFEAIPETDHETLANWLERRGAADLAVSNLTGLSLETMVDISLRYGFTDRLQELVNLYGVSGIRRIDNGRGISVGILGVEEHDHSLLVCIGAYLLSQGRVALVQRLARECLVVQDEAGTREAFILASLLLAIDPAEPRKILQEVVGEKQEEPEDEYATETEAAFSNEYPITSLVRDYIL